MSDELYYAEHFNEPEMPKTEIPTTRIDLTKLQETVGSIKHELRKVIVGQERLMDLLLVAIFANGHVLLEGMPGIAKTLTARMIAQTLDVPFSRIQFTPDLMPSDVVGTTVFNMQTSQFVFNAGPIFANIVLIDEINRAPAKTQSALFEVMEENQVTVDGTTYIIEQPFFTIATQNPIEQEGTYRLPEAQLDRFLFKIQLDYPSRAEEKMILLRFQNDFGIRQVKEVKKVCTAADILACRALIEQVFIEEKLLDYIADIVYQTRYHSDLYLGASPRASLALLKSSKALAAMNGRDFVIPDDIQRVAYEVLNHRILLKPEREIEGYTTKDVVNEILQQLEVPR